MTSNQDLAIYYKKTKTCYTEFLKEFFSKKSQSENLRHRIKNNENILQQELPIDEMFLIEALTFLRLSIFNFLAYKDLMCGNYLAWSKVTWYYSIFYAINGMLRLDGKAIIHVDGISFQLIRDRKFHSYKMTKSKGNEHKKVWEIFSKAFPDSSDSSFSRFIRGERVSWNYDLFFMSQTMNQYALDEASICCEHNFIDKHFSDYPTLEATQHYDEFRFNHGSEEIFAWDLIKKGLEMIKDLGKKSNFKDEYIVFWNTLIHDMNKVHSKEETKTVIRLFIESLREETQ